MEYTTEPATENVPENTFEHIQKDTSFFRRKAFYVPALAVALVIVIVLMFSGNGGDNFETQVVELTTVSQVVSETGSVISGKDIALAFARSGRVANVHVEKGDHVFRGQALASLDIGSLDAELRQALAALELERGSVQQNALTLRNAQQNLIDEIVDAYVTADDVVQGTVDQLFEDPASSRPSFGITITQGATTFHIGASPQQTDEIDALRATVEDRLAELESIVFNISPGEAEAVALQTENVLQDVQQLLAAIAASLNEYVAGDTAVQTIYEGFKSGISTVRTRTGTALNTLRTAMQNVENARTTVEIPGQELGPINLQDIRIEQAQARVDAVLSSINDARIVSPISGIITDVSIHVGEVTGTTVSAISLISDNNLEISVDILEDDIEFVQTGDLADVRFDAYDNVVFKAEVIFVSPRAVEKEGSPAFEVILEFKEEDPRIRAGLSVDVDIISEIREGVISIPSRSVIEEDGMRFVRVLVDESVYRRQSVTLGLRGEGGMVEVMDGLQEGMRVITFIDPDVLDQLTLVE